MRCSIELRPCIPPSLNTAPALLLSASATAFGGWEVFGSAARASDFDPAHSDADFLVEFAPGVEPGLHSIFGAKADLEALLGRGVDLVEPGAVRNPYVLASINRQRAIIFSAED